GDRPARDLELDQQLGREERATRFDRDPLERLAPEELAGAVDVAHPEAEEDPVGEAVGPGVEGPDERIRPLDPEPDDDVRTIRLREAVDEPSDVGDPELPVPVRECDVV